jgi:hypothetical protein
MFGNASACTLSIHLISRKNTFSPNIVFTRLSFWKVVQDGKRVALLKAYNDLDVVKLNHKQRTFNSNLQRLTFRHLKIFCTNTT